MLNQLEAQKLINLECSTVQTLRKLERQRVRLFKRQDLIWLDSLDTQKLKQLDTLRSLERQTGQQRRQLERQMLRTLESQKLSASDSLETQKVSKPETQDSRRLEAESVIQRRNLESQNVRDLVSGSYFRLRKLASTSSIRVFSTTMVIIHTFAVQIMMKSTIELVHQII